MTAFVNGLGSEVVVTVLAFLLGLSVRRIRRMLLNRKIESDYPVSGSYYSTFDDEIGGRTVEQHEIIHLRQNGNEFDGSSEMLGSDRTGWSFAGQILEHRYLSGIYFQENPADPSRGMYFLEPTTGEDGAYSGIWAGFDSANRRVASGSYRWRRIPAVERLDPKNESDVNQCLSLFSHTLGDRLVSREIVQDSGEDSSRLARVSKDHGKIQGACLGVVLSTDESREFMRSLRQLNLAVPGLNSLKLGRLDSIAVDPKGRGRGVGAALTRACLTGLRKQGCTGVVAYSWVHDGDNSRPTLERAGFEEIAVIPEHWKEDSVARDLVCPACGEPPCLCSATLMLARI